MFFFFPNKEKLFFLESIPCISCKQQGNNSKELENVSWVLLFQGSYLPLTLITSFLHFLPSQAA